MVSQRGLFQQSNIEHLLINVKVSNNKLKRAGAELCKSPYWFDQLNWKGLYRGFINLQKLMFGGRMDKKNQIKIYCSAYSWHWHKQIEA